MTYVVLRQVDAWRLGEHGLDSIRGFLRFLDATDRLHPASTRMPTLLKEPDRLGPRFPAVMADTSRWRLAKRVFTAIDPGRRNHPGRGTGRARCLGTTVQCP